MVKGVQVFPANLIVFLNLLFSEDVCIGEYECKFAKLLTDLSGAMDEH